MFLSLCFNNLIEISVFFFFFFCLLRSKEIKKKHNIQIERRNLITCERNKQRAENFHFGTVCKFLDCFFFFIFPQSFEDIRVV